MNVYEFFRQQLAVWQDAADRYEALAGVKVKQVGAMRIQYNPARIVSTGAKVDRSAVAARPCFLCLNNRPPQQLSIVWNGRYEILVNPFPIFPRHFTIAAIEHTPQHMAGRIADMLGLASEMPGYTVFFNGAHCGASAPDHMHFQAVDSESLPIWSNDIVPHLRINGTDAVEIERKFERLLDVVGSDEMNVLCKVCREEYSLIVIPRRRHRPSFYGTGEDEFLVSPASVDLGGVIVTPRECDYERMNAEIAGRIIDEVCYSREDINELSKQL